MNDRVALLTNMPAPYRLPFFKELNRYCDLLVVFDGYIEPNRQWKLGEEELGIRYTFAQGLCIPYQRKRLDIGASGERYLRIQYDIIPTLYAFKPSVVVSAEMGPRTLQAAVYCEVTNTPLIIWWEGTQHTEGWVRKKKSYLRKFLVRRARRFWSNGYASTALLLDYGAAPDAIDEGMISADTNLLVQETRNILALRAQLRSELRLNGVVFLFVGRYVEAKGIKEYLEALNLLYGVGLREWSVVFVGSGPLESVLRSWQVEHPDIPTLISDFVQPQELPKFYAIADVLVMPTLEDNWSLVALEAAVAGVPQLFSVYNGCTSDLLWDERVGCVVDPLKVGELASALEDYVHGPLPRLPDELVQWFAGHYGPEQVAARARASLQKALG